VVEGPICLRDCAGLVGGMVYEPGIVILAVGVRDPVDREH